MSAVDDAKQLIQILTKKDMTNEQIQQIAMEFGVVNIQAIIAENKDQLTNEELAANLLLMFRQFGKSIRGAYAVRLLDEQHKVAQQQAAETARDTF